MVELTRVKPVLSILAAGIAIALAGCSSLVAEQSETNRFSLKVETAEEKKVDTSLGVALSGGGVRSALFNLGLLKWLYDEQVLDKVDIVSSVSGGGYTAYWMYANHFKKPDVPRFAYGSFDQSQFSRSACEVITTSNMVTFTDVLGAIALPGLSAPKMYERELGDTFGRLDDKLAVNTLATMTSASPKVPYFVMNATVVDPVPSKGWADGRIELTPLLKGNDHANYSEWTQGQSLPLRQAIAISGAAIRPFLKQQIDNPVPGIPQDKIILSDGGHSENLGAIALIRRGVKKVIIGDAEHDPRYKFDAYVNLRTRLKSWGLTLRVPTLDTYLAPGNPEKGRPPTDGLHTGVVINDATNAEVSTIYYVKMGRPKAIREMMSKAGDTARAKGKEVNLAFYKRLDDTKVPSTNAHQDYYWQCDTAIDLDREKMRNWFTYELGRYIDAADNSWGMRALQWLPLDFVHSDFPQYSTLDQNFNLTQAMAFIALGYFEAEELKSHVVAIGAK